VKILIIGETCNDEFIYGEVYRVCPEAPVPILDINQFGSSVLSLGMAANVLSNLKAIAAKEDEELDFDVITTNCGLKTRYIDKNSNQILLRVDKPEEATSLKSAIRDYDFNLYDAVVVSDYNKGMLDDDDLCYIAREAKLSFLDTKKKYSYLWANEFTFIKINDKEAQENGFFQNWISACANTIVTKGSKGCLFSNKEYAVESPLAVRDVCGAGDTFLAALAFKYIRSNDIESSIKYAIDCCSVVVSKKGVCTI
tara:strand:- start:2116 stop:2877 length:762 start_codon:yes stop_codon:yes gene_type:complete